MRNLGLIITFWLASIALPTNSFALGLGQIEVNSFLNQPLSAEIEVISARAGEIDDLLVTLASRDSFKLAGLSRPRHLTDLRFAVKKNEAGDSAVILVTTKSAVKEPFLNFLVEADWSKGRVLREFTVLLDPPFYADTPAPAEIVPQSTTSESTISSTTVPTPIVEEPSTSEMVTPIATTSITELSEDQIITEPIELSDEPVDLSADELVDLSADEPADLSADEIIALSTEELVELYGNKPTGSKPIALSEETDSIVEIEEEQTIFADESETVVVGDLQVKKGDTLWGIASEFTDSEHNIDQVMLAIQSMNPGAFNDNNINNLKIGAVLRAPDGEELDRLSKREAHVQVLRQNGLWDDYVARVTGSTPVSKAGDGGSDGASGESSSDLGDLSLLAPGGGDSDAGGLQSEGTNADELARRLALAEEELEASQVENSDLESRIAELEATLSKVQELQKMVEIEDDSLAQLQADQAAETVAAEAAAAEAAAAEAAAAAAAEEQAVIDQALEAAIQAEQESAATTLSEEALLEKMLAEESTSGGVTPPAPVIVTEPEPGSDSILDGIIPPAILDMLSGVLDLLPSMDSILADPIILGALGGVVLLLLILILVKRRRGSDPDADDGITVSIPDSDDDLFGVDDNEFTPINLAAQTSREETDINVPDSEDPNDNDISHTAVTPPGDASEGVTQESATELQDDTLNEVDVYLAYGLYDNAEDLLNQTLEANPERADYRAKLLDTYFATKNAEKFSEHAATLRSMGSAADVYWSKVQAMGYELTPDNELFSGGKDSDISTADFGVSKPEAADFDLGSSEDDTNFSTTDFNLGGDSEQFIDTQGFAETVTREEEAGPEEVAATQILPNLDELPGLEGDSGASDESEDELDELEFAFDGADDAAAESGDDGAMDFELPDDMSVADDDPVAEDDEMSMDFEMDDSSLELDSDSSSDQEDIDAEATALIEATALVDMVDDFNSTAFEIDSDADSDSTAFEIDSDADSDALSDIDLGMDDTSLDDDETDDGEIALDMLDDDDDIESTAFTSAIDEDVVDVGDDISLELDDEDVAAMGIDLDSEPAKTDTFAPGDFDDPEELMASEAAIEDIGIDDFDDFMLPDDVDEVGTKLDLARAFIDMGDAEGARSSLDEVLSEGSEEQKAEATNIIKHL